MKTLEKKLSQASYLRVQKMIWGIVNRFVKKYGGDREEYLGEANVAFVRAWKAFDPEKARLTTWVHALLSLKRKEATEATRMPERDRGYDVSNHTSPQDFDLFSTLGELSSDAAELACLALSPPQHLRVREGDFEEAKRAIAGHLMDRGWSGERVVRAMEEVRGALRR